VSNWKGINFRKIVENALTVLVTSVFLGAGVIVWNGATTVDQRVRSTEDGLKSLIDNLSTKLSSYEVQLQAQSNQLAEVYAEVKRLHPTHTYTNAPREFMQQRAVEQDIRRQLLKK